MNYQYPDALIQVFCKAPVPGKVKTRLMPELTAQQAANVHQELTRRTLELVTSSSLCPVQLWCSPDCLHPFFIEMAALFSVNLMCQSSTDLGDRMYHALQSGAKTNRQVLLIGCDCVSLTKKELMLAIQALSTNYDTVLAPAEDGGYCLIGSHFPTRALFSDISWGSSKVMQQTRNKIQLLGLNCLELETQWDVDQYADYLRYQSLNPAFSTSM